jgi:hypothetical protein
VRRPSEMQLAISCGAKCLKISKKLPEIQGLQDKNKRKIAILGRAKQNLNDFLMKMYKNLLKRGQKTLKMQNSKR